MVEAQIIVRRFIEAAEKFNEAFSMNEEFTVKLENLKDIVDRQNSKENSQESKSSSHVYKRQNVRRFALSRGCFLLMRTCLKEAKSSTHSLVSVQREVMSNCQSRLSSLYGGSESEWLEILWNCTEKMAQFDNKGDA